MQPDIQFDQSDFQRVMQQYVNADSSDDRYQSTFLRYIFSNTYHESIRHLQNIINDRERSPTQYSDFCKYLTSIMPPGTCDPSVVTEPCSEAFTYFLVALYNSQNDISKLRGISDICFLCRIGYQMRIARNVRLRLGESHTKMSYQQPQQAEEAQQPQISDQDDEYIMMSYYDPKNWVAIANERTNELIKYEYTSHLPKPTGRSLLLSPHDYTILMGISRQGGGSRRKRTAHRKRKNRRKSKRVHHTRRKHTRRHRHSRRRHHRR